MSVKKRRKSRVDRKFKLSTAQPAHESKFEEYENGVCNHVAKTETGTLAYFYVRDEMHKTLWSLCAHFQLCARAGGPIDFEEFARRVGADIPFDITVDVDQTFLDEAEANARHALSRVFG
jgi:hypothetical protein